MKKQILSIDVGIRNLSFCLFEISDINSYCILKWDNIDLTESEPTLCSIIGCNKTVKFSKKGVCWCLSHSKMQPYIKLPQELTKTAIAKTKVGDLRQLMVKYKINQTSKDTRPVMVASLINYADSQCLDPISVVNAVRLNLVVIGRNIQHKLNAVFGERVGEIATVIIENQIGPIATKMKTVQGMLVQYFIMKNNDIQVEFVSASNKLKGLTNEDLDYKGRKKAGVLCCGDQIESEWKPFFQSHKKKDDLADCFLQGVWYIKNKQYK